MLEKELQTFRTTKEARDRTGEEEVRRMLEQEREKRRKKAGKWWRTFGKAEPAVETPGRRLSFRPF